VVVRSRIVSLFNKGSVTSGSDIATIDSLGDGLPGFLMSIMSAGRSRSHRWNHRSLRIGAGSRFLDKANGLEPVVKLRGTADPASTVPSNGLHAPLRTMQHRPDGGPANRKAAGQGGGCRRN
jgi:hypothetical protein